MSVPNSAAGELVRLVKPRALPAEALTVEANEAERAALAGRLGVTAVHKLVAEVTFDTKDEAVLANGKLSATIEQPCAVTQDDFVYAVDEPLTLRFVPTRPLPEFAPDEEIELDSEDLDEIEYEGDAFDLGEAIAQSLALALDPYREGPGADAARKAAGIVSDEELIPSGPLAEALAALKGKGG
ncbi:YceD family protein [Erythrobacter mangrovi]|uniref:DUF177 domain-containing protein n=1 Tax=Erythrobacter mangrovi TaxID=2739433 RepID=A0A7D3XTW8_9SPHN|nr:DUF177 domain-containing protein [Erythrobacter mangrovi]QKG70396.1 DUF177 domain-containing protein [Erythrobacter mangrovi]